MVWKVRRRNLVSQHVDVALVHKDMLGVAEAIDCLGREQAPYVRCRRRNHVHDAIVEAALKIERTLGEYMARALLRDERVPDSVAARVFAREPGQLRAKKPAP